MATTDEAGGFTAEWDRRERVLEAFETAWRRGERPALNKFLTGALANRGALLGDLAQADLEWRLKSGEAARVEDYLQRFPELAAQTEAVRRLIATEYGFRRQREPDLSPTHYQERFPQYRAELGSFFMEAPESLPGHRAVKGGPGTAGTPGELGFPAVRVYQILEELGCGGMG